ncbi:hypothetical protein EYF80_037758 [Liparis tanakae]|uniref:Uncharacterized protein n=1 Tax=Liparis tanakae TaxID=230148 RepID=A0A4Z2GGM6_9TELE|nr:hypothetical protein EYF80_037758 [Liparis tanakae]
MNSNLAGTSESRLTLIRSRPASFSFGRSRAKFMPLVVTAMVFRPSSFLSSSAEGEGSERKRRAICRIRTKELMINDDVAHTEPEAAHQLIVL